MSIHKGKILLLAISALVLAGSACLFSPSDKGTGGSDYYSPVDTPQKLLDNFKLAYTTKNLNAYMECLHEEFEFMLLEIDWEDYTGNGEIDQSWGRDIEESMTENMFNSTDAEIIELTLDGDTESVWYGDSTNATLQLVRSFDLKVYYWDGDEQKGYHAVGLAVFLCKPNEDGDYQIWRWEDLSET
ncbi:MAG: hypothetical protein K8S62_09810 [Candidatus Sabulitectum sp.]|nr:hypothetical protein [Candidatus Sabulitectum sp.]